MKKTKQFLVAVMTVCLLMAMLPMAALAANANEKTIYAKYVDGSQPEYSFTQESGFNSEGLFLYGASGDTYTLTSAVGILVVNDVAVTVGNGGSFGKVYLAGAKASLTDGTLSVAAVNQRAISNPADAEISAVAGLINENYFGNATLSGAYSGSGGFKDVAVGAYTLTVPKNGELIINGALTVGDGGTVIGEAPVAAEDNDARLALRGSATFSGITLYDSDKTTAWTDTTVDENFSYDNTAAKWVRETGNQGATRPEDGQFNIDWNDYTPEKGTAAVVKYTITDGTEQTATRNTCVAIGTGADIAFSVTPPKNSEGISEGFWGLRVTTNGADGAEDTVVDVPASKITESSGVYTFTIQRDENVTTGFLVEIFWQNPNPNPPQQTANYSLRFDNNALAVTMNEAPIANEINQAEFPESGDLVFTFAAKEKANEFDPDNVFYGLIVRTDGVAKYLKANSLLNIATNKYTYTITEAEITAAKAANTAIEIQGVSQAIPFDNEYVTDYDSTKGQVFVNGTPMASGAVTSFGNDGTLAFALTPAAGMGAPYKAELLVNGSNEATDLTAEFADNAYEYTPAFNAGDLTKAGFTLKIWWTEAEYLYDTLSADWNNEFMLEYNIRNNGSVTFAPTVAAEKTATYGENTRAVFSKDVKSLTFTITPATGQEIQAVFYNGNDVTAQVSPTNTFTIDTSSGGSQWLNVEFTGNYAITVSSTAGGTMEPAGTVYVKDRGRQNIGITPDYGYTLTDVKIDGTSLGTVDLEKVIRNGGYQFEEVAADHTLAATFTVDPTAKPFTDYAALKTYIEGNIWAYYSEDINTTALAKTAMGNTLWDTVYHDYKGAFVNKAAAVSAITVTEGGSDTTLLDGGTAIGYYNYTVTFPNNNGTATGEIYRLPQMQDFILKATKSGVNTCYLKSLTMAENAPADQSPCVNSSFAVDYDTLTFYGIRAGGKTGTSDYFDAFHVFGANNINCQVIVYKPAFAGALVTTSGEDKIAMAWDFGIYPMVCFNGTTAEAPDAYDIYFGFSSVTLSVPKVTGIAINSITKITSTLPKGAITIAGTKVTFNSNFYDEIPLTITYLDNGTEKTGNILIRRVGIDIQAYHKNGSEQTHQTNHGTSPGVIFPWGDSSYAVYGTYYYPTGTEEVDLYATYTWQDGSVTTALIDEKQSTAGNAVFAACDDFCLYLGTEEAAPVKISVIAVRQGSDGEIFSGAMLGAGTGVTWLAPQDN